MRNPDGWTRARETKGCESYTPQWTESRLIMGEIFLVVFGSTEMQGGVLPTKLLAAYFGASLSVLGGSVLDVLDMGIQHKVPEVSM